MKCSLRLCCCLETRAEEICINDWWAGCHVAKPFPSSWFKPRSRTSQNLGIRSTANTSKRRSSVRSLPASKFVSSLTIDRGNPGARRDCLSSLPREDNNNCPVVKSRPRFSFSKKRLLFYSTQLLSIHSSFQQHRDISFCKSARFFRLRDVGGAVSLATLTVSAHVHPIMAKHGKAWHGKG
jgi:hypothetical protein